MVSRRLALLIFSSVAHALGHGEKCNIWIDVKKQWHNIFSVYRLLSILTLSLHTYYLLLVWAHYYLSKNYSCVCRMAPTILTFAFLRYVSFAEKRKRMCGQFQNFFILKVCLSLTWKYFFVSVCFFFFLF